MKLTVLGKYGPFPKMGGGTSSYLLQEGDTNICLDLGDGSLSRLQNYIQIKDISAIILTHLHFDHMTDIGILNYALSSMAMSDKKIKLYLPNQPIALFNVIKELSAFEIIPIENQAKIEIDNIKIKFIKMQHPVISYAVKASNGKTVLSYTGDTNECENLHYLLQGCNYALMDCGFLYKDWQLAKPHLSVAHCAKYAKQYNFKLFITHINPNYNESDIFLEAKENCENFEIVSELQVYEL